MYPYPSHISDIHFTIHSNECSLNFPVFFFRPKSFHWKTKSIYFPSKRYIPILNCLIYTTKTKASEKKVDGSWLIQYSPKLFSKITFSMMERYKNLKCMPLETALCFLKFMVQFAFAVFSRIFKFCLIWRGRYLHWLMVFVRNFVQLGTFTDFFAHL